MGDYSVKKIVQLYTRDLERVNWDKYVWNRLTIPKHRIFVWLTMHNRLQTTSRLHKMAIATNANCLICDDAVETQEHLMFECKFSFVVFSSIRKWCGLPNNHTTVNAILRWIARSKKNKFQKHMLFAIVGAMIYHIWCTRNDVFWNHRVVAIHNIINHIQKDVIGRMYRVMPKKTDIGGKEWLRNLANQVCI
ncbi:uncharacterized protein LOC104897493 [Beta vulgaris subsp. vulgaris]|uniref:uncharacterized protein LOC104897493 n=1 Tax=Beta vulgaris subsp. vulgaris TaxID=3555 RepID=UPI00053F42B8|nr:uncharacterized protein LOC104897493 [Beta vulgaris subsp. vulgaris]